MLLFGHRGHYFYRCITVPLIRQHRAFLLNVTRGGGWAAGEPSSFKIGVPHRFQREWKRYIEERRALAG